MVGVAEVGWGDALLVSSEAAVMLENADWG